MIKTFYRKISVILISCILISCILICNLCFVCQAKDFLIKDKSILVVFNFTESIDIYPIGNEIENRYDKVGNIIEVEVPNGSLTKFDYDKKFSFYTI